MAKANSTAAKKPQNKTAAKAVKEPVKPEMAPEVLPPADQVLPDCPQDAPENAEEAADRATAASSSCAQFDSARPLNAVVAESGLVTYRVTAPQGLRLREGPGRAYHQLAVLPAGTEVMGVDLTGMLRADRKPGEAAWVKVLSKDGSGWVDSSFLERVC